MKYLVMENHRSYSIVMDEAGMFHRVANLGYEVGDTITEPVFMKSPECKEKNNFNWKKISTIAAIFVCLLLAGIPLISSNSANDMEVYMSINPEVHLEVNENGKISKLVADNEDGKVLIEGYKKYRGESLSGVLIELINRAEQLDYLTEGGNIRITVKSENPIKAESVLMNLSEDLNKAYFGKFLIKIKANESAFRRVEELLKEKYNILNSLETETALSSERLSSESVSYESYTEKKMDCTQGSDERTTENSSETEKATVSSKPADKPTVVTKPTEDPTIITQPSEPTTEEPTTEESTTDESTTEEPTTETDSSDSTEGSDDDDDHNSDHDWEWPWPWPWWPGYWFSGK